MRSSTYSRAAVVATGLLASTVSAAFDAKAKTNVAIYWGQGNAQIDLSEVCGDASVDIVNIGFVNGFPKKVGDYPSTNFANACGDEKFLYPNGTKSGLLSNCPTINAGIKKCQANGKKVLLSLGGGAPTDYYLQTKPIAEYFAEFLWGAFGPQTATWTNAKNPRPFGDAVVDGFDFDIESSFPKGKEPFADYLDANYGNMINHFRNVLFPSSPKTYYISAAPQCIVPDVHLANAISTSNFDFIFVQFYNTPECSTRAGFDGLSTVSTKFTFETWATWLKTNSKNEEVKLYLGAPAGVAGVERDTASYLTPMEANALISSVSQKYPEIFGGVMLWEATVSSKNVICDKPYATYIKNILLKKYVEPTCKPSTTTSSAPVPSATGGTSPDGTCGGEQGYTCSGWNLGECCSKWGFCGGTEAHCGVDCVPGFGKCGAAGITTSSSVVSTTSTKPSSSSTIISTSTKPSTTSTKPSTTSTKPSSSTIIPTSTKPSTTSTKSSTTSTKSSTTSSKPSTTSTKPSSASTLSPSSSSIPATTSSSSSSSSSSVISSSTVSSSSIISSSSSSASSSSSTESSSSSSVASSSSSASSSSEVIPTTTASSSSSTESSSSVASSSTEALLPTTGSSSSSSDISSSSGVSSTESSSGYPSIPTTDVTKDGYPTASSSSTSCTTTSKGASSTVSSSSEEVYPTESSSDYPSYPTDSSSEKIYPATSSSSTSCTTTSSVVSSSSLPEFVFPGESSSEKVYPTADIPKSPASSSSEKVYPTASPSAEIPNGPASSSPAGYPGVPVITATPYPTASSPSKAHVTTATTITTTYVDICSTGLTTITTTIVKSVCPKCEDTPKTADLPKGWHTTVAVCNNCGPKPTTVTLTKPAPKPTGAAYVPHQPEEGAYVPNTPTPNKGGEAPVVPVVPQKETVVPNTPTKGGEGYPSVPQKEYVPNAPEQGNYIPGKPEEETYVPVTPAEESSVPVKPTGEVYVPGKPTGETYVPGTPEQDSNVPSKPSAPHDVVITLTKVPIPATAVPAPAPPASYAPVPAPAPAPYGAANSTNVYAPTGAATSTGSYPYSTGGSYPTGPAEFEGAASRFSVGMTAVVALVAGLLVL